MRHIVLRDGVVLQHDKLNDRTAPLTPITVLQQDDAAIQFISRREKGECLLHFSKLYLDNISGSSIFQATT